ncbi:MAG TPA: N-acetylgalactosamine-6-sulfatase, partial [Candidatus Aminicenantes bacterium]|nr:N-acetylgalactosamine-6-sulfatase [Candidatus Aminicenantes bacterium]
MMEEALHFIEENKSHPFFLYLALPLPHVALQVPDDSLQEYQGQFPETPYLGEKGYLPHPTPRAAYAAMISRLDREVGRVMNLLKKLGLEEKTLVIFTSDNGPTYAGGVDYEFFNSAGPLRGLKGSLYEGGIRVPLLVKWPGQVKPGTVSDHVSAFWDFLPTFIEIIGRPTPVETDGISMLPTWLGHPEKQITHEYLYWELHGQQAVRWGDWKGIRRSPEKEIELYNLRTDI